jgi:hypothetical protein
VDILQLAIIAMCLPTGAAYVCRLSQLSLKQHAYRIIVMHIALAMSVGWAGYRALIGDCDFGDFAAALGASMWILISYETWRTHVPDHFNTRPSVLDELDYQHISGGREE